MARDEETGDGDGRSWEAFVRAPTVGNSRRLCSATLEGQPAKTDCVDVSPDGRSLLIVATDLIHIVVSGMQRGTGARWRTALILA